MQGCIGLATWTPDGAILIATLSCLGQTKPYDPHPPPSIVSRDSAALQQRGGFRQFHTA